MASFTGSSFGWAKFSFLGSQWSWLNGFKNPFCFWSLDCPISFLSLGTKHAFLIFVWERKKLYTTGKDKTSICRLISLSFILKKSEPIQSLNKWQVLQTLSNVCSPAVNPLHYVSFLSKKKKKNPVLNALNHFTVVSSGRWTFLENNLSLLYL